MNKKLIISLSTIAAIAIIAIGASVAYFSNTEKSEGNTFIAGAIDLKIDNECHYNGNVCTGDVWEGNSSYPVPGTQCSCTWGVADWVDGTAIFSLTDIKPGDSGEDTISLHVDSNPAWVCAEISNVTSTENGCNPPEAKVDGTCGDTGPGEGELHDNLVFDIWMETDCNNEHDPDEVYVLQNAKLTDMKWPIADSVTGDKQPIRSTCIGVAWSVSSEVNNIIQGDSVTGDITFNAYQSRNNMNFRCIEGDGCLDQADLMLVLDRSASIDSGERAALKAAAKAFVTAMNPDGGVHMGQTSFADTGSLDLHLTGNATSINAAIDGLAGGTYTNLYEGILYADQELDGTASGSNERPSVPDYMVIITDGQPNRPDCIGSTSCAAARNAAAGAATTAKGKGVTIYVVGVGGDVDSTYLKNQIATSPAHYFGIGGYDDLEDILEAIANCQTPELPPVPETVHLNPDSGNDTTFYTGPHVLTPTELGYLVSNDGTRYQSAGFWTEESYTDNEVIDFGFADIPSGATNVSVTLKFDWQRDSNEIDGARVRIWDGSSWTNHEFSTPLPSADTDRTETISLSEINTAAEVNAMIVRFQAHDGFSQLYTRNDWVQVDVIYTP